MPVAQDSGRLVALPGGEAARIFADDEGVEYIAFGATEGPSPSLGLTAPFAVYCPHTMRHAHTAAGLPDNATLVNVSASTVAYYVALLDWWSHGETFAVIEHDVVCRRDVIEEFESCPEPWCTYGYSTICHEACMEGWRNALGCTRFRAELMETIPDAVSSIPRENWDWHNVCDGLGNNLRAAGYSHHWHRPWVDHYR